MPVAHTANVMPAWARIDGQARRRFSIHVNAKLEDGAAEAEVKAAREAATLLLGLPWELLYDGDGFLFQGAKPTRVRRRLPNTRVLDVPVLATPIRCSRGCRGAPRRRIPPARRAWCRSAIAE